VRSLLRSRRERYLGLEARLKASKLANAQAQRQRIARERERTLRLSERGQRALQTALRRLEARVEHSGQLLSALSYRSVLARGFALVRDQADRAVHSAQSLTPGARMSIEFSDGRVAATADGERPAAEPTQPKAGRSETKPAPKRVAKPVDQGSLF
jgi:exodeoxyribonuclease VII large subunit